MVELINILHKIDNLQAELSTLRVLSAPALCKIEDALRIEYTYDSNRLEGNTLTLQETALVVNQGITIGGKSLREHLEAINHAQAVDFIAEVAAGAAPITESVIRNIHGIVLYGIDRQNAGCYRTVQVMISGSRFVPPEPYLIPQQMESFVTEYGRMESAGMHPVLVAAYLHDELVRIHPFIDGNGRTSRLLMNFHLLRYNYPVVSLKGDNGLKLRYYNALEKSHTTGDRNDFNTYLAETVHTTLMQYVQFLRG